MIRNVYSHLGLLYLVKLLMSWRQYFVIICLRKLGCVIILMNMKAYCQRKLNVLNKYYFLLFHVIIVIYVFLKKIHIL